MRVLENFKQMCKSGLFVSTSILIGVVSISLTLSVVLESFLFLSDPLPRADAIVVMAGGREMRVPPVAALFRDGAAPKVLLTNDGVLASWSQKYQRNLYLVEWAREDLIAKGVPHDAIVLLNYTSSGTIHDALNTHSYVSTHPEIRSLLVVTSDYHTRRTIWTFRRVFEGEGVQIGIYPVNDLSKCWLRHAYLHYFEFFKYIYYRVKY